MAATVMETSNQSMEMATVAADPAVQAMEMATVAAAPAGQGVVGQHMHKNRLQEYAQRSRLPLPSYSTINEGEAHAPKFRATILVDGMKIISPYTFSHLKEAEQYVAKLAFEIISVKFKNEGSNNIHKDPAFCKLILNEYGVKLKKDRPTYTTTQQNGLLPTFTTTIIFDGKAYVGFAGRSKKEAEQNAACVVIDTILANSSTVTEMAQIIKTKGRLYATRNTNAGNDAFKNEIKSDDAVADAVIKGTEIVSIATNENFPVGSTSWAPYTCPWVDIAESSEMKYQIPSSGLPMMVVDSQDFVSKKRKMRLKKRKANLAKKIRVDEQPLTTTLP